MSEPSPRFTLTRTDIRKVAKGILIAAAGAVLTYVTTEVLPQLETAQPALFIVFSAVVNLGRKWLENNTTD